MKNVFRFAYVRFTYFISIVWIHFSDKTEKLQFWKSLKDFNVLWWKLWCQIWIIISNSVLLRCENPTKWSNTLKQFVRILAVSWEIRIKIFPCFFFFFFFFFFFVLFKFLGITNQQVRNDFFDYWRY